MTKTSGTASPEHGKRMQQARTRDNKLCPRDKLFLSVLVALLKPYRRRIAD